MICPNCRKEAGETAKFCDGCGTLLIEKEKINEENEVRIHCHVCNSIIEEQDKYCLNCGAKLNNSNVDHSETPIIQPVSHGPIWFSITSVIISFMLSSFGMILPIITGVISLGALGFAIYKYVRVGNRLNIWAIGFGVLAILVSGVGITSDLVERKYAYEIPEKIGEIIEIEFPEVRPSFYSIAIMDEVIVKAQFNDYAHNEVVLQLTEEQAAEFRSMYEDIFTNVNQEKLEDNFSTIMLAEPYVSVVYNLEEKTFGFPATMDEYNLIVVNYYINENWIQILEINKRSN